VIAPGQGARWLARPILLAAALEFLALSACRRVAETSPSQVAALSRHGPGQPPVAIRTLDGDRVDIHGDFHLVRIVETDVEADREREIVLRPPFLAARSESWLLYQRRGEAPSQLDLERVKSVTVVQYDSNRTTLILSVVTAAVVVGAAGGAFLAAETDDASGDSICPLCGPVFGAMFLGGVSVAIVVPITKYY
jgi:hypothetical protein